MAAPSWTPWIAVYGAAVATITLGWRLYEWRRQPQQAARMAQEVARSRQKTEALRAIQGTIPMSISMCEEWLERYQQDPDQVSPGIVGPKVSGRLKNLRRVWGEGEEFVPGPVREAYDRGRIAEAIIDLEQGSPDLAAVMSIVERVRVSLVELQRAVDRALE